MPNRYDHSSGTRRGRRFPGRLVSADEHTDLLADAIAEQDGGDLDDPGDTGWDPDRGTGEDDGGYSPEERAMHVIAP